MTAALVTYALRLGDDALVLSQRLAAWATHAHELEEDVALTNIALDLLGQARTLLSYAGRVEEAGRDEDALAFRRDESEFVNCQLVELDNGDFATTMARQLLFSAYQFELYGALCGSADALLAGVAGKAVKEVAYHRDHAQRWVLRLGDGTTESHNRMQAALDAVWPYAAELFVADEVEDSLVGIAVDPATLRPRWDGFVTGVMTAATLGVPTGDWNPGGGRQGRHTETFGFLLAEMQYLHRSHPGARW